MSAQGQAARQGARAAEASCTQPPCPALPSVQIPPSTTYAITPMKRPMEEDGEEKSPSKKKKKIQKKGAGLRSQPSFPALAPGRVSTPHPPPPRAQDACCCCVCSDAILKSFFSMTKYSAGREHRWGGYACEGRGGRGARSTRATVPWGRRPADVPPPRLS